MARTINVFDIEDTQAALLRIMSFVDMLREYTEPHAADQTSEYHHEFETLTLNLHNLHELVYQLHADVSKTIAAAYNKRAEG